MYIDNVILKEKLRAKQICLARTFYFLFVSIKLIFFILSSIIKGRISLLGFEKSERGELWRKKLEKSKSFWL